LSSLNFSRAIVRPPGPNFAAGLTSALAGAPDLELALRQHSRYCDVLQECGLELTSLDPDPAYPDGTFVEDAAIVTARGAILARPGAPSRTGEIDSVGEALRAHAARGAAVRRIEAPGTVDGGDVCEADGHFVIGVSARTNEDGANQLKKHLESMNFSASLIDIRSSKTLLHLKTGIAYLGDGAWLVAAGLEHELESLARLYMRVLITVSRDEAYAANCVRVNDSVLVPAGYPRLVAALRSADFRPVLLDMSEFKKMDGGLSCLSLRF
jgi:dimethylargininase